MQMKCKLLTWAEALIQSKFVGSLMYWAFYSCPKMPSKRYTRTIIGVSKQ